MTEIIEISNGMTFAFIGIAGGILLGICSRMIATCWDSIQLLVNA